MTLHVAVSVESAVVRFSFEHEGEWYGRTCERAGDPRVDLRRIDALARAAVRTAVVLGVDFRDVAFDVAGPLDDTAQARLTGIGAATNIEAIRVAYARDNGGDPEDSTP